MMNAQVTVANYRLAQDLEILEHRLSRRKAAIADLSDSGADILDGAATIAEQGQLLRLLAFDEMRLNQVRHAVEWHENGHRGLCEDCRRPIDPARLEAIPCATRCVLCQEKWERSAKRRRSYW